MKYKYIHIFCVEESNYSKRIITFINNYPDDFNSSAHFFVTPYKTVIEALPDNDNILYYREGNGVTASLVNSYCEKADWIFLHGLPAPKEIINIKNKYLKKIIWRTWGHDIYDPHSVKIDGIRAAIKKLLYIYVDKKISNFKAIGVSNIVDRISVSQILRKEVAIKIVPYPSNLNILNYVVQEHEGINILLGHSGYPNDNHIGLLTKLEKYRNEDIHIYTILSYGDKEYIGEVEKYVKTNWSDKTTIIKNMLPYEEYVKFLSKIDIAIMDGMKSYALGNLFLLINMKKKIVLNSKGILAKAFDEIKIPYLTTDDLGKYSPDILFEPFEYENGIPLEFKFRTLEENKEIWKDLLSYLSC